MASATVSTEFGETYSLNYQALIGQSIILIVISSIVDGSPFLLLNSAMVLGTCVLLKEIIQNTILVLPGQGQNPHVLPLADVGQGVVQERETDTTLPIAKSSKSKYSRQKKPTRDYEPMRFSKSLSVRGSKYIYDTREVESGDVAPEPIIKNDTTDEKAKELIQEPRAKHPHESLEKMTTSSTLTLPIATSSRSQHSRQKKPTRDYQPIRFSKSLSDREGRYFYDARRVESSDKAPEPTSKTYSMEGKAEELIKEYRVEGLHGSLERVMVASSTPPLLSAPRIAKDLAGKVQDTPSRASSTTVAGFFIFIIIIAIFVFSGCLVDTLDADEEVWWHDALLL